MGRKDFAPSEDNLQFRFNQQGEPEFFTVTEVRAQQAARDRKLNPQRRDVIVGRSGGFLQLQDQEPSLRTQNPFGVPVEPINNVAELPKVGSPIFNPCDTRFHYCTQPGPDDHKTVYRRKRTSPSSIGRVSYRGIRGQALDGEKTYDRMHAGMLADEATFGLYIPSRKIDIGHRLYIGSPRDRSAGALIFHMLGPSDDITESRFFESLEFPESSPFASRSTTHALQSRYEQMAREEDGRYLIAFVARVVEFYSRLKATHDADVQRVLRMKPDRISPRRPIDARQRMTRFNMELADGRQVPLIAVMDFLQESRQPRLKQEAPFRKASIIDQKLKVPRRSSHLAGYCTQTALGNFAELARRAYPHGKQHLSRFEASRMKNYLHDFATQEWVPLRVPYDTYAHVIGAASFTYFSQLTADPGVRAEALRRAGIELTRLGSQISIVETTVPDLRGREQMVADMYKARQNGTFKPRVRNWVMS